MMSRAAAAPEYCCSPVISVPSQIAWRRRRGPKRVSRPPSADEQLRIEASTVILVGHLAPGSPK